MSSRGVNSMQSSLAVHTPDMRMFITSLALVVAAQALHLPSCAEYCDSLYSNRQVSTPRPECTCTIKINKKYSKLKRTAALDDSGIYYEPSRATYPSKSFSETPFHIANPIVKHRNHYDIIVEAKGKANMDHDKKTLRYNSERNHETKNIVHEIDIESGDVPLYLDVGILKTNIDKRSSEQSGEDIKLSEGALVECIDLHIVFFSRSNGMDKDLVNIWDKNKFKRYERLSDSELTNEIQDKCRHPAKIMKESLQEIKKSKPTKFNIYSTDDFQEKYDTIESFNSSRKDKWDHSDNRARKSGNLIDTIFFFSTESTTELPNSKDSAFIKFAQNKDFEIRFTTHLTHDTVDITTASYDDNLVDYFTHKDVESTNTKHNFIKLFDSKKNNAGTVSFQEITNSDLTREAASETTDSTEANISTSNSVSIYSTIMGKALKEREENSEKLHHSLSNVLLTESPIKGVVKEFDSSIMDFTNSMSDYENTDQSFITRQYEYSDNYTTIDNFANDSTKNSSNYGLIISKLSNQSSSTNNVMPFTAASNNETETVAPDLISSHYTITTPTFHKFSDRESNMKEKIFIQVKNTKQKSSEIDSLNIADTVELTSIFPSSTATVPLWTLNEIASSSSLSHHLNTNQEISQMGTVSNNTAYYNNQKNTVKSDFLAEYSSTIKHIKNISDTTDGLTEPTDMTHRYNTSSIKEYLHDNYDLNETLVLKNVILSNKTTSAIDFQNSDDSTIDGQLKSTTVIPADITQKNKITNSDDEYSMQDNYINKTTVATVKEIPDNNTNLTIDYKSSDHFTTEREYKPDHTKYLYKSEVRKEYPEIEMKIPKIMTKELENDTVISDVDGIEAVPNSDFKEWGNNTGSGDATATVSTATSSFKILPTRRVTQTNLGALSPLDNVFGKLYFVFGHKLIPVRFVQDSEGQLKLGIDGGSLCNKIVQDKLNVSLILAAICKCALSENCANDLYEPS